MDFFVFTIVQLGASWLHTRDVETISTSKTNVMQHFKRFLFPERAP